MADLREGLDELPYELQRSIASLEKRTGMKVHIEPVLPRRPIVERTPEESYRFGREIAYAYGVQPWLIDPQYNTRAERWRWRWHRLMRPWRFLKRTVRRARRRLGV